MDTLFKKLLEQSFTIRQLEHHLRVIKKYLDFKLFTDQKASLDLTGEDKEWLSSLGADFLNNFNKDNLDQNLSKLEQMVQDLKVLTIYVPFNLPQPEVVKLG